MTDHAEKLKEIGQWNHAAYLREDAAAYMKHAAPESINHGVALRWQKIAGDIETLLTIATAQQAELVRLREENEKLRHSNEINAADALRALEFDLVVGAHLPELTSYCERRIAAIKSSNVTESLAAREANWQAGYDRLQDVLSRLLHWDHLDGSADGPYWRKEITVALHPGATHER